MQSVQTLGNDRQLLKITNFLGSQIAALKMPLIPVTYHHVHA
jgi:hypothetical protein